MILAGYDRTVAEWAAYIGNDRRGKGKILIEYHSLEDFDRILEALKGN